MKFESFLRLFGKRGPRQSPKRKRKPHARRSVLEVERLESRELLAAPFIDRITSPPTPPDGSTSDNPRPNLSITFSEDVRAAEAGNRANYLLFDSQGNAVSIDGANYDSTRHVVLLSYNNRQP